MATKENLILAMEELGLSGKDVADALGVSGAIVSEWRSGKSPFRRFHALAFQSLFGVRWEWLMTGEGSMRMPTASASRFPADTLDIPIFEGLPSFESDGESVDATRSLAFQRLRLGALNAYLARDKAGTLATLALVRVPPDEDMRPYLTPGGLILVNTARTLRLRPPQNALLLLDFDGEGTPRFRRVLGSMDSAVLTLGTENPMQKNRDYKIRPELDSEVIGVAIL